MRDNEQGTFGEVLLDGALDERIGGFIDDGGRFVENHNLRPYDDRAREAEELPLTLGEIQTAL